MLEMLANGLVNIISPGVLICLLGGVTVGLILGAIPGLSATMAIALVIPFTYYLTPTQAIVMCLGAFNGGCFGGSISAILLATPGTTAASATVMDGYAMAQKGQATKAVKTALFSSMFGCMFATILLIFVAEPIAKYALEIGPAEYTILMLFAMTIIGSASGENVFKGLAAGALGLLLGTVGFDPMEGSSRLTFGLVKLSSGIDLVVMLIGLLALSAIMIQVENLAPAQQQTSMLPPPKGPEDEKLSRKEVKRLLPIWFQSALIGSGIGALPGLGTTLAAWLGYDTAKRRSKHPERFGTGIIEGVAGPEAANNAVCGSNMIPLLTMGIPGDVTAALLVGAFMLQGLTPGPMIFQEDPQSVYNIYVGLLASNLILLVMTFVLMRAFKQVSKLPPNIIIPCVCMFCMVGVYALFTSLEDIMIMLIFTVVGFILMKFGYPVACMLVGFILSPMLEKYARMALTMSDGNFNIFFHRTLDWVLWAVVAISIVTIVHSRRKSARKLKAEYEAAQAAGAADDGTIDAEIVDAEIVETVDPADVADRVSVEADRSDPGDSR